MVEFVRGSLLVLAAYGALGFLFAVTFHWHGLHALDAGSRGTGIGFRLLITPGLVALWPLLAARWRRAKHGGSFLGGPETPVSPRRLRAIHALGWKALAVILPLTIAAALWWRPKEAPPARLPAPTTLRDSHSRPGRASSAVDDNAHPFKHGDAPAWTA